MSIRTNQPNNLATRFLSSIGRMSQGFWLKALGYLLVLLFLFFFVIPLAYFFVLSFFTFIQSGKYEAAFTLANYSRLVSESLYLRIMGDTFKLGLISVLVCVMLGYPIAFLLGRSSSRWRNLALAIVVASLFTNLVVRSFGWMVLLSQNGLLNNVLFKLNLIREPLDLIFNMTGVVIGVAQVQLPVFILVVAGVIQLIDQDLVNSALVIGADELQTFFTVIWPLSLRGVIGGASLVFALSISSYITPHFLSGGRVIYASTYINTLITKTLNYPMAGALSMILILSSVAVIGGLSWTSRRFA